MQDVQDVQDFAATLGEVIWQATVSDPPFGGYSEGGIEAALVKKNDRYKLVAVVYSNDPYSSASMDAEERAAVLAAPWLDRSEIRERILDELDASGMDADPGYLSQPCSNLWPEQAVDAALAAAGCDPVDEDAS